MRKLREIFLKAALIAAAVITGGILLFLIGIILKRGLPQLSWSFLTTATSYLAGTTGASSPTSATRSISFSSPWA